MFGDVYSGKRVFITGHTGFKGSWLAAWLKMLGAELTGYALPPAYPDSHFELLKLKNQIRHIENDIRDLKPLKQAMADARPDLVFHLAAQALVRESYADPKTTFDTNVGGSVNVLESVRACDSARALVYITSDKCYRNVEWEWGYREPDVLGGDDPYSGSKGCAELVFRSYRESFFNQKPGINVGVTRAGNVIGGGDWAKDRIVPDCIRALRKKDPIVVRNPKATRPWQHVLEPLGGYLLLGARLFKSQGKFTPSEFNFGPDKTSNKTVEEVVNRIIGVWGSGQMVVHHDDHAVHEAMLLQLNCDRAWHYLKWRPTWHYDDSVEQTALWYKAHNQGADMAAYTHSQIEKYMRDWKGGDV